MPKCECGKISLTGYDDTILDSAVDIKKRLLK